MKFIIDGKETNKHKDKKSLTGFVDKTPIIRMEERNGKIIANVKSNTQKKTLFKNINNHIAINSIVMTDELLAYKGMVDHIHKKINHSKRKYAKVDMIDDIKNISTNGIENFWSIFKRGH